MASTGESTPDKDRPRSPRRWRILMVATSVPFLSFAVWQWVSGYAAQGDPWVDYLSYRDAAARWLAGGTFYEPWQLTGPYEVWAHHGAVLYPPTILILLIPFVALPSLLWWVAPMAITVAVLLKQRPAASAWPFLAMCLAWPNTQIVIAHGNPSIWVVAALALGTLWAWPSVLVLLKPSLFPFAFVGVTRRAWWVAACVLAAVSLPFGSMWLDWYRAITLPTDIGFAYSAKEIPTLMLPIVAALGATNANRFGAGRLTGRAWLLLRQKGTRW